MNEHDAIERCPTCSRASNVAEVGTLWEDGGIALVFFVIGFLCAAFGRVQT